MKLSEIAVRIVSYFIVFLFCCFKTAFALDDIENAKLSRGNGNVGLGPLSTLSLSPGHILRPNAAMSVPTRVPKHSWVIDALVTWGNVCSTEEDHFRIDGEWICVNLKQSYSFSDRLEAGIRIPVIGRTGGFADGFIEGFHDTFGFGNDKRDNYPRNKAVVDVRANDGERTVLEGEKWGIGDLSVCASWRLTEGDRFLPSIVMGSSIALPTGDEKELSGAGEPVFGIVLLLTKRVMNSRWVGFLGGSGSYCDNDKILGIEVRKEEYTLLTGLEYEWSSHVSLIMQNLTSSPLAKDYYEFSRTVNELTVGTKICIGDHGILEIGFREDLFYFNNSADFGIHVGYKQVL